jgi:hypothetical protein
MIANLQMTAAKRAEEAIAANPGLSDRAIAEKIGVGSNTVRRARRWSTAPDGAVRIGKDGRSRRVPQRKDDHVNVRGNDDEKRKVYLAASPEAREMFDRYCNSPVKIRDQLWRLIILAGEVGSPRRPNSTRDGLNIPWARKGEK